MLVILLGAPGSGKGTQASMLRDSLGFIHINVGSIFRHMQERNPKMFQVVQPIMQSGGLVPNEITIQVVKNELIKHTASDNIVLDGFPRNAVQADALRDIMRSIGISDRDLKVINLEAPKDTLVTRLKGRGRSDDNEVTIAVRLSVYNAQTAPVKDKFSDIIRSIDSSQDIGEVHELIRGSIYD